ncbi:MAG: hypothetical protein K8W52_33825 [Deltaproteobacteria bacterium]|nr:hypothetical protein [Deltaproteobacteria bacterium]
MGSWTEAPRWRGFGVFGYAVAVYLTQFDQGWPLLPRAASSKRSFQMRTVAALYSRCFPRLRTASTRKIYVDCVERPDARVPGELDVVMVEIGFDEPAFQRADAHGRKVIALDALQAGALKVATAHRWPRAPFDAAYKAVRALDFVNEWTWPRTRKVDASRRYFAYLACRHDSARFRAEIVIEDRRGVEISRTLAIDELPDEFIFGGKLGKLVWTSPTKVELFERFGERVCAVALPRSK